MASAPSKAGFRKGEAPKAVRPPPVSKRTSIGSGKPLNRHKRRNWKAYRGQGR